MISILLPIYNGERYLQKSLNSVLNQTYKDFELLIGFNGTADESKDIVRSFNDQRIKIFDYGEDKGKGKTLNKLVKESSFDWIALQDDDDVWQHNKLEKQVSFLTGEYDVVGTQIQYIDSNDNFIGNLKLSTSLDMIKSLSLGGNNQIANSSSIIKKTSLNSVNGWKESIDGVEDFDLWLRLLRLGKKIVNLPDVLVNHRLHNKSNYNTKNFSKLIGDILNHEN